MTAHAQPLPASAVPARLRAAGALSLLTWPALDASGVDAAVTARDGGVSSGPYATLNLSLSVGDDPARVLENRRRLAAALGARPADFVFARQVHGAGVRIVGEADRGSGAFRLDDAIADTDALVTTSPGVVLAILTADCVPIVLHDPVAGVLACVHAGWRGTVARVCAAAVAAMTSLGSRPADVIAGLGPAASPARYQVGPDVHHAVTQAFGPAAAAFIRPNPKAPTPPEASAPPAPPEAPGPLARALAPRPVGRQPPRPPRGRPPRPPDPHHRPPHRPHRSHRPRLLLQRPRSPPMRPPGPRRPPPPPESATNGCDTVMALSVRVPHPPARGRVFRYGYSAPTPSAGC